MRRLPKSQWRPLHFVRLRGKTWRMDTLEKFRDETRQWLKANAPQSMYASLRSTDDACWGGRKTTYPPDVKRWLDVMAERGWTAPTWPKQYGGGGLNKAEAKVLARRWRNSGSAPHSWASG